MLEVNTRSINRATVIAESREALIKDRDAVLKEIDQVVATISRIRDDEAPLTGVASPHSSRRFYPVAVLTEGFPVNPITITMLRKAARDEGILVEPDVAPLEILDTVELEMAESIAQRGGPTLRQLLDAKAESNFRSDSLRNFLVAHPQYQARRPLRLDAIFERGFDATVEELEKAQRPDAKD